MKGGKAMNMSNMNEVVESVTVSGVRSISPDNDSKKSGDVKQVTLKIKYDGLMLKDVFAKAFKNDVVAWQNGAGGRKNFDNIVNKQVIEVSAKAPGSAPAADPMESIIASAKASGLTVEQYVLAEMKKRMK
jgi:hypothetical protein